MKMDLVLYLKMLKMAILSQMEYKLSFVVSSLSHFFQIIIELGGLYYLFQRFPLISGFTIYEAMLFFGTVHIAFGLTEMWARAFDVFDKYIREGSFDRLLLRPVGLFTQIMGAEFQLLRIGRIAAGGVALYFGLTQSGIHLTWDKALLLTYAILGAVMMFASLFIIQATATFFTVDALEVFNAFTYGGVEMSQYPMSIYKEWFRNIFLYMVPIGGVTYFSVMLILGRPVHPLLAYGFPSLGFIMIAIAIQAFNRIGVAGYQSTGG